MKKYFNLMFLAAIVIMFISCEKSETDNSSDNVTAQKGFAIGKVVDAQGKPIQGAKIFLDHAIAYASYLHGTTDEKGIYKISVQEGVWAAFGTVKKEYHGKTYEMELQPSHANSFGTEGTVCNFTWLLEGKYRDREKEFLGCRVAVDPAYDFYEGFKDVVLTFTPDGPLIDGSQGRTITVSYGDPKWQDYFNIEDIPLGRYKVTGILKSPSGNIPLKIQDKMKDDGPFVSELQLNFYPDGGYHGRNSALIAIGN